jgi:chaperone required for assembly of F1-ATPase
MQHEHFAPVTAWLAKTHNIHPRLAEGIMPVAQPPEHADILRNLLEAQDDHRLTLTSALTHATGSLFLSLYFLNGLMTPEALFSAARLDENYQMEKWGRTDMHAQKEEKLRREIEAARRFATLLMNTEV